MRVIVAHRIRSGRVTRTLEGRRAVVTGASRGIGAGIARRLATEGADVVLVARTLGEPQDDTTGLHAIQARRQANGVTAGVVVADITDEAARARVIPEAVAILGGPVEIPVNNAAAAIPVALTDVSAKQ
jgi:NAD(P)-dependent dehydrogenase (short-subunit alcohol dehydrogenase family)